MDSHQFDRLTRLLSLSPPRRTVLGLLAGSAPGIGALTDLAAKRKKKRRRKKKKRKVTLCHNGQTISVGKKAKKAHLAHGDTLGTCPSGPGQACTSRDDCVTARCVSGTCQPCVTAGDCGTDKDGGMCACRDGAAGFRICTKLDGRFIAGGTCADCVAGEQCTLPPGGAECLLSCGA